MKKITSLISALIISVVSFTGVSNAADSKKPIVIPTHNWSSQIVMAYVIGGIFESMGNNVSHNNLARPVMCWNYYRLATVA